MFRMGQSMILKSLHCCIRNHLMYSDLPMLCLSLTLPCIFYVFYELIICTDRYNDRKENGKGTDSFVTNERPFFPQ